MKAHPHPLNRNLTLCYDRQYKGLPVILKHSPLIREYLARILQTVNISHSEYNHLLVLRFDLHIPLAVDDQYLDNSKALSNFFKVLNANIERKRYATISEGKRWHNTKLRYIWAKEYSGSVRPHYHVALLLNGDTFRGFGSFDPSKEHLYTLIQDAWSKSFGITFEQTSGFVNLPDNPKYSIRKSNSIAEVFYRLSYLAKANTKHWSNYSHQFGSSRK